MKEGDVVLTPLPQADGMIKNRPAIILREMPPYRDFLVCGVSTQLKVNLIAATYEVAKDSEPIDPITWFRGSTARNPRLLIKRLEICFVNSIGDYLIKSPS